MPNSVSATMVRKALQEVEDPELHRSIVDLHMVRDVAVEDGHVMVEVALTVAGCPLHHRIQEDVEGAVGRLSGVDRVTVHLAVMDEDERRQAFAQAFRRPAPGGARAATASGREIPLRQAPSGPPLLNRTTKTHLIGIASGKGGVGKSTVTANLAVALQRQGARVGLMDMDVYGFSQGRLFGVGGQPTVTPDQKIVPWNAHGVALVSMGMFVPEHEAIVWRGPMLGKMMQQFFSDVAWGDLDYLLIDLPPGTGDIALDMAQKVNHAGLVLVTTPEPIATEVARRTASLAQKAQQRVLGVVENMSFVRCPHGTALPIFGEGGGELLATTLEVPLLGRIPLASEVREASGHGTPIVLADPDSEAAEAFLAVAETLSRLL